MLYYQWVERWEVPFLFFCFSTKYLGFSLILSDNLYTTVPRKCMCDSSLFPLHIARPMWFGYFQLTHWSADFDALTVYMIPGIFLWNCQHGRSDAQLKAALALRSELLPHCQEAMWGHLEQQAPIGCHRYAKRNRGRFLRHFTMYVRFPLEKNNHQEACFPLHLCSPFCCSLFGVVDVANGVISHLPSLILLSPYRYNFLPLPQVCTDHRHRTQLFVHHVIP